MFLSKRIDAEMNAGNTPYIKMGTLTDMEINIPKELAEQSQIAVVLNNMSTEIEFLEIKKRKAESLKQGMMQNLLTGKIRLV